MSRNMKMTVIPIIIRTPGTIPKNLEKRLTEHEIQGRIETVQNSGISKNIENVWFGFFVLMACQSSWVTQY